MASVVNRIVDRKLASPPKWLATNVHYETIMGSVAYGVSSDTSDMDVYGFCIPKKEEVFPHLAGKSVGFGKQQKPWAQWQEHHINDDEAGKEYDVVIYSIVKYFQLCMENNPNMIDSMFTPAECVLHTTKVGQMVRENRHLFLSKKSWHSFKGYAHAQLHKAEIKNPKPGSKRYENFQKYGWDVKFGYHVVRLINEAEQILSECDLDLRRNREHLKAIRRGEETFEDTKKWFTEKELSLQKLYESSSLRYSADEEQIKQLLLDCLEEHYGSLDKVIINPDRATVALKEIQSVIDKHSDLLG